ncbi:hypothetical protein B0T25DRAFT_576908 [Lasiosphaeria hispida]|uniref:Uncharacterized protein n=1 Tax=Lasiosphaeria hispida TaxID=260671 RepID=A0AAJ0HXH2_9PEZI|nr:hypothetical protein B0T25DRAFT_576908 [Lasiosphaeria hispida]
MALKCGTIPIGDDPDRLADVEKHDLVCALWDLPRDRLAQYGKLPNLKLEIKTYGDLIILVRFLKHRMNVERTKLVGDIVADHLLLHFPGHVEFDGRIIPLTSDNEGTILDALELALSVWSMVSIGKSLVTPGATSTIGNEGKIQGGKPAPPPLKPAMLPVPRKDPNKDEPDVWLKGKLRRQAKDAAMSSQTVSHDVEFSDYFTLCGMERLVGFRIVWTHNLLDHLQLRKLRVARFSTHIHVFHHATVLHSLAIGGPKEKAEAEGGGHPIDPSVGMRPASSWRVRDFQYWQPRLLRLETEYDTASPRVGVQWWRDKRRRGNWVTLWVAIVGATLAALALLIGIVSVTGGISTQEAILANERDDRLASESLKSIVPRDLLNGEGVAASCFCVDSRASASSSPFATALGGHITTQVQRERARG